jgi:hypothetical protein
MTIDTVELLEGLRYGNSREASGSRLFQKLLEGKDPRELAANPLVEDLLEGIKRNTAEFRGQPLTEISYHVLNRFFEDGDRKEFQKLYFDRRLRLIAYSLLVWFYGREEDIHALEDTIWAVCNEYSWCLAAHYRTGGVLPPRGERFRNGILEDQGFDTSLRIDLAAAETGIGLSECCAMLEDKLAPAVVARARSEVFRRLIRSYLEEGGIQFWELQENNWCAVVAGGIGIASLYLVEDDAYLAGIVHRLLPTMDRFLGSFPPDGVSREGLSYWTYGVGYFVMFADLLWRRSGGKIDLLKDPRFPPIARFQQYCYFPYGGTLAFSDVNNFGYSLGLSCYLAKRVEDVHVPPRDYIMDDLDRNNPVCHRFGVILRDFIWSDKETIKDYVSPPSLVFPGAQWLVCRTGDVGFAAKGGHNGESHNHNDVGSFFYFKRGRMVFCDVGRGEYTRHYFGPERYTIFPVQSLSHNVPVVNGQSQKPGKEFGAGSFDSPGEGEMIVEFAGAYGLGELKTLERRYKFDLADASLRIRDTYVFNSPIPVTERFVSLCKPIPGDGPVIFEAEGAKVTLSCSEKIRPVLGELRFRNDRSQTVTVYTIDYPIPVGPGAYTLEFFIK